MRNHPLNTQQRTVIDYKKRICMAMNYISDNLTSELSLEEIARSAAFSPFHFHRVFKAVVGETVAGFTRRLRLEKAANRLLSRTQDDITLIAYDCGFSSSQNFARAFRQQFNMSPTQFRNSKNGNAVSNTGNALSLQMQYNPDTAYMNNITNRERNTDMQAEVKNMPELNVAYVRKLGAYGKETCEQGFAELMHWAGAKGLLNAESKILGVYWDNPEVTPPEKCRFDACATVPENTPTTGVVNTQKIDGGSYAVCHFEITDDSFQQAWEDAFAWLIEGGYECDEKPCFELYHNDGSEHPEGKWIFDICIPLITA